MPEASSCQPCCTTSTTVNVPGVAGADGAAGADGSNGVNAYTVTTADFVVPAVGANVTVSVANSTWMVAGQKIFVGGDINAGAGTGGAYFEVVSKPGTTSVILTFLGYEDDVAVATTFDSGAGVSPGGTQPLAVTASRLSNYGAVTDRDTAYDFTNSEAEVSIASNGINLTINQVGTWMIMARIRIDYSQATYSTDNNNLNLKIRRTNNTPADVSNTTVIAKLRDVTTAYFTADVVDLPPVFYTTTSTSDVLSLYGWLDTLPDNTGAGASGNGKILAYEASIVAVKMATS